MDKFKLAELIRQSEVIDRIKFIQDKCPGKDVLDLGSVMHCIDYRINEPDWLHGAIKSVARKTIGVDYLPGPVRQLQEIGYNIILGDVTKPLPVTDKFDVIVAGDLIEHLTNFEGFFQNCRNLLNNNGILIITTVNPFFFKWFLYIFLKNRYLVNPEHTCYIDPQCLSHLSERSGFDIKELYFIKDIVGIGPWLSETKNHTCNMRTGEWTNNSFIFKASKKIVSKIFTCLYFPLKIVMKRIAKPCIYSDYLAVLERNDKKF